MTYLKDIRKKRNVSQQIVANYLGISRQAYSNYETGAREPDFETLLKLGEFFEVTVDDILTGEKPSNAIPYEPTGVRPVVGRIAAGAPVVAVEDIEGYEPVDVPDPENYYWLRVEGRSMINAGILPGDLALIRMQNCAENGNIVACRVNGDEATLKRFEQQGDTVFLLPENTDPEYKKYIIPVKEFETGYAAILGVLVETKRKY